MDWCLLLPNAHTHTDESGQTWGSAPYFNMQVGGVSKENLYCLFTKSGLI